MSAGASIAAQVLTKASEARAVFDGARSGGRRAGLVLTMGALHAGHLALVEEARRRADFVVASVFVNPAQFGPNEDFARYPRDLEGDVSKLSGAGVSAVFAPDVGELYPPGEQTRVRVGPLAEPLCGRFRPGHFEGVATVVAKFFSIAGPCVAIFGRKDYQQLLVIRRMARDLCFPVDVVGHPIVREPDGLAMSSRNAYLSPAERSDALALSRGLDAADRAYAGGERRTAELERIAREPVARVAASIDYVEARDAETLAAVELAVAPVVLAIACRIGTTRLIDNRILGAVPSV